MPIARRRHTIGPCQKRRKLAFHRKQVHEDEAHSSDEEVAPKQQHLQACVLEFLTSFDVSHTVDAFVKHWSSLSLNATSNHVSQIGTFVCPSTWDVKWFIQHHEMFRLGENDVIVQVKHTSRPPQLQQRRHTMCGVVLRSPPGAANTITGRQTRGHYTLTPEYPAQAKQIEANGWAHTFDLVVQEGRVNEAAMYGLFAAPVVQRAVTRISGAVFIEGYPGLHRHVVQRAVTEVFTHRPLCNRQYVIHWASFWYSVLPSKEVPSETSTSSSKDTNHSWNDFVGADLVIGDHIGQQVSTVPITASDTSTPSDRLPLQWRNATCKSHIIQGRLLFMQQEQQRAGVMHALQTEFLDHTRPAAVHNALVIRILSRPTTGATFQASYLLLVQARGPCALALAKCFPCTNNMAWVTCVQDTPGPETDAMIHATAQVRDVLVTPVQDVHPLSVPAEPSEEDQLLMSPSARAPRVCFSSEPLCEGRGYNSEQQRQRHSLPNPSPLLGRPLPSPPQLQLWRDQDSYEEEEDDEVVRALSL